MVTVETEVADTAAVAVEAAAADLAQQLLEVATTLRHSSLSSAQQVVRPLHLVCKTGRSAAVATVTELHLGYADPESDVCKLSKKVPEELPWPLLLSAKHLEMLSVSWERLQQLAAKQHEGQGFMALFVPRLRQLSVGGMLLHDSGAHLAQLLQSANSLQAITLQTRDCLLSFGSHPAPPVLKELRSVRTGLQLCPHTVTPWLQKYTQLQELSLLASHQTAADMSWVGSLTTLTKLVHANPKLERLPSNWSTLQQLRKLEANRCGILQLPEELCHSWQALEELELDDNLLTSLPDSISCLTSLTGLHVRGNQLTQLPEGITALRKLVLLSASQNFLGALPPGPRSVTNLDLHCSNQLTDLRGLTAFPSLAVADLSACGLDNLQDADLSQLTALRELDLSFNGLKQAEGWVLPPSLHKLGVQGHRLTSFGDLRQLSSCCSGLQELQLATILPSQAPRDVGVLGVLPHLTRLDISWDSSSRATARGSSAEQAWQPLSDWLALQPQLVELTLHAADMQHLASLPTPLTRLELPSVVQVPPALLQLPQLRHLKLNSRLQPSKMPAWCSRLAHLWQL